MSLLHISRKAYRNLTTNRQPCLGLIGRCGSLGGIRSAFGRRAIDAFWMEPTKPNDKAAVAVSLNEITDWPAFGHKTVR
jgi:hypothetical protein